MRIMHKCFRMKIELCISRIVLFVYYLRTAVLDTRLNSLRSPGSYKPSKLHFLLNSNFHCGIPKFMFEELWTWKTDCINDKDDGIGKGTNDPKRTEDGRNFDERVE